MNYANFNPLAVSFDHPRHASNAARQRRDIDGLRCIAVLPVLFYHADLWPFASGYLGVDIFFVISGFLIGGIIDRDLTLGRFNLREFYVRRSRRLMPSMVVMIAVVTALCWFLMGGRELQLSSVGAASALLGVSNFYFLWSTNYFATALNISPFLMTWSLGVEQQFYLIFPFVMLALTRLPDHLRVPAIGALSLLSLAGCLILASHLPSATFYMLPSRFWELSLGALLAMSQNRGWLKSSPAVDTAMGVAGLAALLVALTVAASLPHPGPITLLPVIGTLMLLHTDKGWVNKHLLSWTPLVAIGLISYSLYLWHMPILELMELVHFGRPAIWERIGCLVLAIFVGWLSWRSVEQPFRRPSPGKSRSLKLDLGIIGTFAATLSVLIVLKGFPQRLPQEAAKVEAMITDSRKDPCLTNFGHSSPKADSVCDRPGSAGKAVALLGDSHAAALGTAMTQAGEEKRVRVIRAEKAACAPLFGLEQDYPSRPQHARQCDEFNEAVFRRLAADRSVDTVILTAFWSASELKVKTPGPGGEGAEKDKPNAVTNFKPALIRSIRRYADAGKKVVVVGDVPLFRFDPAKEAMSDALPLRGALREWMGQPNAVTQGKAKEALVRSMPVSDRQVAEAVTAVPGTRYVQIADALCEGGQCRYADADGTPFYFDYHHLSEAGAEAVVRSLDFPQIK